MRDRSIIRLDRDQFEAIELRLNGIDGAINRLSDNIGKWLAVIAGGKESADLDTLKTAIDKADAELKGEDDGNTSGSTG